jgi:hypothetical protein
MKISTWLKLMFTPDPAGTRAMVHVQKLDFVTLQPAGQNPEVSSPASSMQLQLLENRFYHLKNLYAILINLLKPSAKSNGTNSNDISGIISVPIIRASDVASEAKCPIFIPDPGPCLDVSVSLLNYSGRCHMLAVLGLISRLVPLQFASVSSSPGIKTD